MTNQNPNMQRDERIKMLEERDFQYAVIYLDDPVLFENLTINDLSILRKFGLDCKNPKEGLTIKGMHFTGNELVEMVDQTIPSTVYSYLQSKNISRGPLPEEIFIIHDIYQNQGMSNISDRFDKQYLNALMRMIGTHLDEQLYTSTRQFMNLVIDPYLLMPMPEILRASLQGMRNPIVIDVMVAVGNIERTLELEEYVRNVLLKTAYLNVALNEHYLRVSGARRGKRLSLDDVSRLQKKLGFDLKGYKPIEDVDAIRMIMMYGDEIKNSSNAMQCFSDVREIGRRTKFGSWISEEYLKITEQIRCEHPLLKL